jgi:Glycosyl hydrolases family 39
VDASFPGLVQDYEIWNEPNTGSLCSSNKQADYLTIYAAAAPLMKQQAAADGVSIRLGGPVTSYANVMFTQALLANTSTAPYVDFVSYHQYLYGNTELDVQWDSYNLAQSIYQVTQGAAASNFNSISSILKSGKQPGGAQTPVFITEFNTNWTFAPDCCKNDPVYGPLWNALYISDLLNTVYSGTQAVPARLVYFAANAYPYFCLIGVPDQNSDCLNSSGATLEPYPQYYTFQLLGSNNYLGLMNGGYMAASITPATHQGGLVVTGFYNSTNGSPQDAIVIVNPTGTTYSQLPIVANNLGISSPQATLYQVVNGASINSSSVSLTQQGSGYTATIDVPPHSVQAISLKGQ